MQYPAEGRGGMTSLQLAESIPSHANAHISMNTLVQR